MESPPHAPGATAHGQVPPTSSGHRWQDIRTDLAHGAPRRIFGDRLKAFADTVPPGAEVIEIGAGHYDHGHFFDNLVRFDADERQHPDIVGDAHDMPIPDGSYDYAVACAVLEHVHDPYQVTREIYRIMRPGGRVFAWVPFFFGVHDFPDDVSRFTEQGFRILFERAGFRVEYSTVEPYDGLFLNLSNLVHFTVPRTHPRRSVRVANQALIMATRAAFPLDKRLKLRTLYTGPELVAVKD